LELPCMQVPLLDPRVAGDAVEYGAEWRSKYSLTTASEAQLLQLLDLQSGRGVLNHGAF
jgi:hypothetical protein